LLLGHFYLSELFPVGVTAVASHGREGKADWRVLAEIDCHVCAALSATCKQLRSKTRRLHALPNTHAQTVVWRLTGDLGLCFRLFCFTYVPSLLDSAWNYIFRVFALCRICGPQHHGCTPGGTFGNVGWNMARV